MNEQLTSVDESFSAVQDNYIGPPPAPPDFLEAPDLDLRNPKSTKSKLLTTINLTIDTCRWPLGDPLEPDFHYCGELPLVSGPYCDKHHSQSYNAPRSKKPSTSIQAVALLD